MYVMEVLKNAIMEKGTVLGNNILKVDSFLNHNVDVKLMWEIGEEFAKRFENENITKIVTMESSGIAPAYAAAMIMGVDMVFARKNKSLTLNDDSSDLAVTEIFSFTKNVLTMAYISKKYISPDDNVLIIDDFLANGEAAMSLVNIVESIGANIKGVGIVIEKTFQKGRKELEDKNLRIESLARIKSLDNNTVTFME